MLFLFLSFSISDPLVCLFKLPDVVGLMFGFVCTPKHFPPSFLFSHILYNHDTKQLIWYVLRLPTGMVQNIWLLPFWLMNIASTKASQFYAHRTKVKFQNQPKQNSSLNHKLQLNGRILTLQCCNFNYEINMLLTGIFAWMGLEFLLDF